MTYSFDGEDIRQIETRRIVRGLSITTPDDTEDDADEGSHGSRFVAGLRDEIGNLADDGDFDGDDRFPDVDDVVDDYVDCYETQHLAEAWADLIAWDSDWAERDGDALSEIRATMRGMGRAIARFVLDYVCVENEDEDEDDEEYEEPQVMAQRVIPGLNIFA